MTRQPGPSIHQTRSNAKRSLPAPAGALVLAFFLAVCALARPALAADKIKVEKLDDLPRHTYKIEGKAVDLYSNDAALMKLAAQVRMDLDADLTKYDIQDKTTRKGFLADLGQIALLEGRWDDYLAGLAERKLIEEKEATRLTTGLYPRAYIAAKKTGEANFDANLSSELARIVNDLPYDVVESNIKSMKGGGEIMSRDLTLGRIEASVQPVLDKSNGEISKDIATGLVASAVTLRLVLPHKDAMVAVYGDWLKAHEKVKPDIWADRDVVLGDQDAAKPVILAVWDSGLDTDVYSKTNQLWTNSKEIPGNGKDDDKDGFVDDVHGIAWSLHSDREIPLLFDIGDISQERPMLQRQTKGLSDIRANIDSPEAQETRKKISSLPQDQVKPFLEGLGKYGDYCHGTHVAGIASAGNPYARLLAARITFDYHLIPETPTVELSEKGVKAAQETVDYFKRAGVRAVNMSWGGSLKSIEQALEANHAGGTVEERKALSRKIYQVERDGLYKAMASAPGILFVTSAGNANADNVFEEFYPSSFDLPNMLTVGAVDQAGDETSFTSFGKADVYANGFEVPSYVPGGDRLKLSGTSMSSPNVMNLAGKLFAKRKSLTPKQVRDLIVTGSDEHKAGQRTVRLMNPKKSMELLGDVQ